jgi:aminoglycoside 6'-N-acetyltransferase I
MAPGDFTIHAAETADRADWIRLRGELWPQLTPEESERQISEMLANGWCCVLASDRSGAAVGLAEAALRHDYVNGCKTSPVAFLEGIYVAPTARRRGVARELVAAIQAWAVEKGCSELASDAGLDNTTSHSMHVALGFEETQRVVYFRRVLR